MKETISSRNVNHDGIGEARVFKDDVGMRSALRGAALSITAIAMSLALFGWTLAGAQAATRWSARVSLVLFALAFAGPGWNALVPSRGAGTIPGQEWPLSLAFAGSHLVHLVTLAVFVSLSGLHLAPLRLAGGALGYALLFLVILHPAARSGVFFYLWWFFLTTYLPRVRGTLPSAGGHPGRSHSSFRFSS
jgi:hypothetical protein